MAIAKQPVVRTVPLTQIQEDALIVMLSEYKEKVGGVEHIAMSDLYNELTKPIPSSSPIF